MKIVQICTNVMSGSVGKIVRDLSEELNKNNIQTLVCYGRGNKLTILNSFKFDNKIDVYSHAILARMFDDDGLHSKRATLRLIKKLEEFEPDIVHLHCLHGYYINYPILFDYLNKKNIKVVWTLHDCWSFTGHCCYFSFENCEKWIKQCERCPQLKTYPKSYFKDNSKRNFQVKKEIFCNLQNLCIVTPSNWLKDLVKKSFFKSKNIEVINNGIDLDIIKGLKNTNKSKKEKIILGVASIWNERKGLQDFVELAKNIKNHSQYKIILVGIKKEQMKLLPNNVIAINRTENREQLFKLYKQATIFFNPTYEDNYPTVNIEAFACGTPIITYNSGGSPELINKFDCGKVIKRKDYKELLRWCDYYYNRQLIISEEELKEISKENMLTKYLDVYNKLMR